MLLGPAAVPERAHEELDDVIEQPGERDEPVLPPIQLLDDEPVRAGSRRTHPDLRQLRRGQMDERKCKLICRCGYFLSCSDYY